MKKKFIYALTGLFFIGVAGCDKIKDFGDTNVNPSAISQANVSALLTNTLTGLGGYALNVTAGYYGQYFSETQYPDASNYTLNQGGFTGNYSGPLYDLQNIIIENKSNNMNTVAKIVQQYIFWQITDQWGDIPYSQALKGGQFASPAYDKQEDIYKGMIKALTDSEAAFDSSPITGDVIFDGNVSSWKRFANSLRMMMSIQLSKKYPGASDYAATQFKAALADADGYIASNSQNAKLTFAAGFKSNLWNQYNGRKDLAESNTMTNLTSSLGDARQNSFGGSSEIAGNNGSSSLGVPYGVTRAVATSFTDANPMWARVLRGDFRTEAGPTYILTAAQVTLARAEAANLGWTTESLSTVYNAGIALSFEQWGAGSPSGSYLDQAGVVLGAVGAVDNVKNISTQRYLASYPDGLQAWNIWRKTGFPVLVPAVAATNASKQIPRRIAYSPTEFTTNKLSVEAAVARLPGGNTQDAKVWWDQ